ncbi:MAG: Uma2 family endonuclease [Candidatus Vecturithrix sp.]|jgi:Uma2 family endonuclease|nr:Uma2 family endonuclease [Candidatus Vecturithrix sp.]
MAIETQRKHYISPEDYLEIERAAEYRSEYLNGEMWAMAGATESHIVIVGNLVREFGNQLKGRPCRVYGNDMRVQVTATGLYTYPDVVLVCGERQFHDQQRDMLLNPTVIIEVLSPSAADYDRAGIPACGAGGTAYHALSASAGSAVAVGRISRSGGCDSSTIYQLSSRAQRGV